MRSIFTSLLIACLSLIISFAIGEGIARITLPPHVTFQVTESTKTFTQGPTTSVEDTTGSIMQVMDWSGSKGVRLNPNVSAMIRNHTLSKQDVLIETNSLGLRYRELAKEKGAEKRILFIGDSITFGDYVAQESTIPQLLETRLKSIPPSPAVINAGLPGANTSDEFHHYLELRDAVDPDLIIVGMYLNDSQESQNFYAKKLRFPFSASRLLSFVNDRLSILAKNSLFTEIKQGQIDPQWRETFRNNRTLVSGDMLNSRDGFDYEIYNAHQDFGLAWNQQSWTNLLPIASSFVEAAAQRKTKIAFVFFPVHFQVYASETALSTFPQEQFQSLCTSIDIDCFDLLPTLRAAARDGLQKNDMYYDHCHFKAHGNKIVADAIGDWIEEKKLLPHVR